MRKCLLILVCAFAWICVNAQILTVTPSNVGGLSIPAGTTTIKFAAGTYSGWSGGDLINGNPNKANVTTIDLSDATFDNTSDWKFKGFTGVTTIIWPKNHSITKIPAEAFMGMGITSVQIPNSVTEIGSQAFRDCESLATLTYEATPHVQYYRSGCFQNTALTSVTIPGSALLIELNAFAEIDELLTVTFNEDCTADLVVQTQAFDNSRNVTDVYILTTAHIQCGNMAFEDDYTYAHGQTKHPKANLHFPDSEASYFTNMKHYLDQETAADDGLFQAWLVEHYSQAQQATEGNNGWWEFVNAGGGDPEDPGFDQAKFLMTYSHPTLAHIVPEGVKAYIVNDVVYNTEHNLFEVVLKSINVIPANTGVILYGETNATSTTNRPSLVMSLVTLAVNVSSGGQTDQIPDGNPLPYAVTVNGVALPQGTIVDLSLRRSNWDTPWDFVKEQKNYLEPTANEAGTSTTLYPFDTDSEGRVAFRNFGFGHFHKTTIADKSFTDYAGFFRCKKKSTIPSGKAYLRLAATDKWGTEDAPLQLTGDELELKIMKDENYYMRANAKSSATATTTYYDERDDGFWDTATWDPAEDFGVRNSSIPASKFIGEPVFEEDETTGVAKILIPVETEEVYYNLNGQRVVNPSHGVFIKNGKKIILK